MTIYSRTIIQAPGQGLETMAKCQRILITKEVKLYKGNLSLLSGASVQLGRETAEETLS